MDKDSSSKLLKKIEKIEKKTLFGTKFECTISISVTQLFLTSSLHFVYNTIQASGFSRLFPYLEILYNITIYILWKPNHKTNNIVYYHCCGKLYGNRPLAQLFSFISYILTSALNKAQVQEKKVKPVINYTPFYPKTVVLNDGLIRNKLTAASFLTLLPHIDRSTVSTRSL